MKRGSNSEMQKTPYQVIEIAQKLKDGLPSRKFRVRAVLKWFGAKRRGDAILTEILETLANYGLTTVPVFNQPGLDESIQFALTSAPSEDSNPIELAALGSSSVEPEPLPVSCRP